MTLTQKIPQNISVSQCIIYIIYIYNYFYYCLLGLIEHYSKEDTVKIVMEAPKRGPSFYEERLFSLILDGAKYTFRWRQI